MLHRRGDLLVECTQKIALLVIHGAQSHASAESARGRGQCGYSGRPEYPRYPHICPLPCSDASILVLLLACAGRSNSRLSTCLFVALALLSCFNVGATGLALRAPSLETSAPQAGRRSGHGMAPRSVLMLQQQLKGGEVLDARGRTCCVSLHRPVRPRVGAEWV